MKIIILPNYGLVSTGEGLRSEPGLNMVLGSLVQSYKDITVISHHVHLLGDSELPLLDFKTIKYVSLGDVSKFNWRWYRGLRYIVDFFLVLKYITVSDFAYIYIPGNIGILGAICCMLAKKSYGLYYRGDFEVVTPKIFHALKTKILRRASFVMCTVKNLKNEVSKLNPNADVEVPVSPLLALGSREFNRNGRDIVKILFAGQIVREKGVFELLDAFRQLSSTNKQKIHLTYAGVGSDRSGLEELIYKYDLSDKVECIGYIADPLKLADLYIEADVFCLPSYHEGFPRVIFEAMKFALPIVVTPVGQIASVIVHSKTGLLCEPRSVESLTNALQQLVISPSLRLSLGNSAKKCLEPMLSSWVNRSHGNQLIDWFDRTPSF